MYENTMLLCCMVISRILLAYSILFQEYAKRISVLIALSRDCYLLVQSYLDYRMIFSIHVLYFINSARRRARKISWKSWRFKINY